MPESTQQMHVRLCGVGLECQAPVALRLFASALSRHHTLDQLRETCFRWTELPSLHSSNHTRYGGVRWRWNAAFAPSLGDVPVEVIHFGATTLDEILQRARNATLDH